MNTTKYNIHFGDKLRIFYTSPDKNIVNETEIYFENARTEVCYYFGINLEFPVFNIFIAPNRKEYDLFVQYYTNIPTLKERIAQPQVIDLYLLSPNAYPIDANCYVYEPNNKYDSEDYRRLIKHEFVHMFEEYLSPKESMEIRPLWWSEGLAVYISNQYKEESNFFLDLKKEIEHKTPNLEELDGNQSYIYGWTVIKFLEEKYGKQSILKIIKENNSENVFETIGIKKVDIVDEWKNYLRENLDLYII